MRIAIAGATGTVGAHTVRFAEAAGHDVLQLARSNGVDLLTGRGLDLEGVDVVIDVSGPRGGTSSKQFFASSQHLLWSLTSTRMVLQNLFVTCAQQKVFLCLLSSVATLSILQILSSSAFFVKRRALIL